MSAFADLRVVEDSRELFAVQVDARLADRLRERRVFFELDGGQRLKTYPQVTEARRDVAVEPYVAFESSHVLVSMGAFSYSRSPLPHGLTIGRYCSIVCDRVGH